MKSLNERLHACCQLLCFKCLNKWMNKKNQLWKHSAVSQCDAMNASMLAYVAISFMLLFSFSLHTNTSFIYAHTYIFKHKKKKRIIWENTFKCMHIADFNLLKKIYIRAILQKITLSIEWDLLANCYFFFIVRQWNFFLLLQQSSL